MLTALFEAIKTRLAVKISMSVFAFIAAFGGAVKAWPDVLPLMPAHRAFVLAQIDDLKTQVTRGLAATNQSVDRLIKAQQEQQLYEAQKDPAATASPVIQGRIRELQQQLEETNKRINQAN